MLLELLKIPKSIENNFLFKVFLGGGWGGGRGNVLRGVRKICYSISKRFAVSGKPLIFSTRSGIFYGWWRCWRSVTSPKMVAILAAIL